MRNRLNRLIFFEFFQLFLPIFLSLIFLGAAYRLSSLGEIDTVYLSLKNTFLVLLYMLPITIPIVLPLSFLFALTLFIIKLRLSNEFIALFISKITPHRIFLSLSMIAMFLFLITLLNGLFFKPLCTRKLQQVITANSFEQIKLIKEKVIKRLDENTFLYTENRKDNILGNVLYYKSTPEKMALTAISAEKMLVHDQKSLFQITFQNGTLANLRGENITISDFGSFSVNPFKERTIENISPRLLPTKALFLITKMDVLAFREKVEICERIYLPFGIIIFLFFVFCFTLSNQKGGYISSIVISLAIGISYFALFFLLYTLGKSGAIEPYKYFAIALVVQLVTGIVAYKYKFIRIF